MLTLPFSAVFLVIPDTIMRAIFAHGAFDRSAAALSAVALATYGVGLPAMALTRIFASTFYARHDTLTPARVTVTAIGVNIVCKLVLVWGFHLGIAGIALGTSLGAWTNVVLLAWLGRRRRLLQFNSEFSGALAPIVLAGLAAALGAAFAVELGGRFLHVMALRQVALLGFAIAAGCLAYGAVVFLFRNRLPLRRSTA